VETRPPFPKRQMWTRQRGRGANPTKIGTKISVLNHESIAGRVLVQSRFFDFDPPKKGGQKSHKTGPGWLAPLRLYQYNKYIEYKNKYLPVGRTIKRFIPPPPGVRVTGLAPGDTGVVSGSSYMLVDNILLRARPQLTCVTPGREGKGVNPGRAPDAARSQKGRRDQSHQFARMSWHASLPQGENRAFLAQFLPVQRRV